MSTSPNQTLQVVQQVFSEYSLSPANEMQVSIAPGATTSVTGKIPTNSSRTITAAVSSTFVGSVIFRKYFGAGLFFIDETVAIAIGSTVAVSSSPLEQVEIFINNPGLAVGLVHVTVLARA